MTHVSQTELGNILFIKCPHNLERRIYLIFRSTFQIKVLISCKVLWTVEYVYISTERAISPAIDMIVSIIYQ